MINKTTFRNKSAHIAILQITIIAKKSSFILIKENIQSTAPKLNKKSKNFIRHYIRSLYRGIYQNPLVLSLILPLLERLARANKKEGAAFAEPSFTLYKIVDYSLNIFLNSHADCCARRVIFLSSDDSPDGHSTLTFCVKPTIPLTCGCLKLSRTIISSLI